MGSVVAMNQHPGDTNHLLAKMSAELQDILAQVEKVIKKSSDLAEQIAVYEKRQPYLAQALEESREVAAALNINAEERIKAVLGRVDGIVAPQKLQIAQLQTEAAEIQQEIKARQPEPEELDTKAGAQEEPESISTNNILSMPTSIDSPRTIYQPHISMETLLSVNGTAALDLMPAVMAEPSVAVDSHEAETQDPVQLQGQEMNDSNQPGSSAALTGEAVPEAISSIPAPPETNMVPSIETMDLEASIIVQRFNTARSWHRKKSRHNWQMQLRVEIPEEAAHVVYNQVLATVTSTLAPYDDVLLNEVFPFDFVEPDDDNVASYLFNLLEDNLRMKDLILNELKVVENDTLLLQKETRNTDIDAMLKGEDIIEQMRARLLAKSQNGEVGAEKPVRKRFGFFHKN